MSGFEGKGLVNTFLDGGHYARALASWSIFTALSEFELHGPKGHVGFAPRTTPDDFKSALTVVESWGSFVQMRSGTPLTARIDLAWGQLRFQTTALELPAGATSGKLVVKAAGKVVEGSHLMKESRVTITLAGGAGLKAD